MKKFINILLVAIMLLLQPINLYAMEEIVGFEEEDVPVLNEQLRRVGARIAENKAFALRLVLPTGLIVMWYGAIADIPSGWVLCDGTNNTPDLRDQFIVGARQDDSGVAKTNVKGSLLQTGGEEAHTLTTVEMPAHDHTLMYGVGGHDLNVEVLQKFDNPDNDNNFALDEEIYLQELSIGTGDTGGDTAHENCPPFYALAYIMKT